MKKIFQIIDVEIVVYFLLCLFVAFFFSYYLVPAEDATMLYRYAENFADTGIISYNIDGPKIEPGVDFLWMIIIAFFYKLGFDSYFSAIFINLTSLFIIVRSLKNYFKLNNFLSALILISHFFLPHTWASLKGFSTLTIELFLVLVTISFLQKKTFNILLFSFLGILFRADFILFILVLNITHLIFSFNLRKFFLYFLFFIFGVIYFIWRFNYFEILFPSPYYIKSQWQIFNNLEWGRQIIILSSTLIILPFANIKSLLSRENMAIFISLIVIPTLYYTNQWLIMNIGQRFYFYFYPAFLILFFNIKYNLEESVISKIRIFLIVIISFTSLIFNIFVGEIHYMKMTNQWPIIKLSNILSEKKKLISIATTESGILPYYSGVNTVDLFGLHTKKFIKKPAGGNFLKQRDFDLLIINTHQEGSDCRGLNNLFLNSRKNLPKDFSPRNNSWSEFTLQLVSGIDPEKYLAYLFPYYHNTDGSPTWIFVNKNGKLFDFVSDAVELYGAKCLVKINN